jgi:two-component system response regulator RegA
MQEIRRIVMLNEPSRLFEISSSIEDESDRTLLLIDDDIVSRTRLARALERKGFDVRATDSFREGMDIARREQPGFAVIELRLGDGNGLDIVSELRKDRPDARIVMRTAYGNIATAVAAIKAGAIDYLPKPADPEAVESALRADGEQALPPPPEDPMSADRVRWEHIQRVYHQYGCNVSETARRLHMHRRTLQRILGKHAPRDTRSDVVVDLRARASA